MKSVGPCIACGLAHSSAQKTGTFYLFETQFFHLGREEVRVRSSSSVSFSPMFCVPVNPDHFLHSPEEGRKVSKVWLRPWCAAGVGGKSPDTPCTHTCWWH